MPHKRALIRGIERLALKDAPGRQSLTSASALGDLRREEVALESDVDDGEDDDDDDFDKSRALGWKEDERGSSSALMKRDKAGKASRKNSLTYHRSRKSHAIEYGQDQQVPEQIRHSKDVPEGNGGALVRRHRSGKPSRRHDGPSPTSRAPLALEDGHRSGQRGLKQIGYSQGAEEAGSRALVRANRVGEGGGPGDDPPVGSSSQSDPVVRNGTSKSTERDNFHPSQAPKYAGHLPHRKALEYGQPSKADKSNSLAVVVSSRRDKDGATKALTDADATDHVNRLQGDKALTYPGGGHGNGDESGALVKASGSGAPERKIKDRLPSLVKRLMSYGSKSRSDDPEDLYHASDHELASRGKEVVHSKRKPAKATSHSRNSESYESSSRRHHVARRSRSKSPASTYNDMKSGPSGRTEPLALSHVSAHGDDDDEDVHESDFGSRSPSREIQPCEPAPLEDDSTSTEMRDYEIQRMQWQKDYEEWKEAEASRRERELVRQRLSYDREERGVEDHEERDSKLPGDGDSGGDRHRGPEERSALVRRPPRTRSPSPGRNRDRGRNRERERERDTKRELSRDPTPENRELWRPSPEAHDRTMMLRPTGRSPARGKQRVQSSRSPERPRGGPLTRREGSQDRSDRSSSRSGSPEKKKKKKKKNPTKQVLSRNTQVINIAGTWTY